MGNEDIYVKVQHPDKWTGPKRYIRVIIYDTVEEMRIAANKYHNDIDDDCLALYGPPRYRELVGKDGKCVDITDKHYGGVIRFNRQYLNYEIIMHEACHAAITIYRRDWKPSVLLYKNNNDNEEHLCYIMGWVADPLLSAIHDYTERRPFKEKK